MLKLSCIGIVFSNLFWENVSNICIEIYEKYSIIMNRCDLREKRMIVIYVKVIIG